MSIFCTGSCNLASCASALNRTGKVFAALLVLASCDVSGSQQVGFQSSIDVAVRMLESGQHASGYRVLDQVAAEHARSPDAHLAIAAAYLEAGAFAKAENAFITAARTGAGRRAEVGLGRVALARNAPDQAIRHFSAVLEKDDGNLAAINGIGVAHDLKRDHVAARTAYNRVLAVDPSNVAALNNLALSNALSGSGETAVAILQDLTGSQINDATLRQNLAIALSVTGRQQDAFRLATADVSDQQAEMIFQLVAQYRRTQS